MDNTGDKQRKMQETLKTLPIHNAVGIITPCILSFWAHLIIILLATWLFVQIRRQIIAKCQAWGLPPKWWWFRRAEPRQAVNTSFGGAYHLGVELNGVYEWGAIPHSPYASDDKPHVLQNKHLKDAQTPGVIWTWGGTLWCAKSRCCTCCSCGKLGGFKQALVVKGIYRGWKTT